MHRYLALAALVLAAISGCGKSLQQPADPTTAALGELRAGNYDNAITLASEALKANPDDAAAYLYRGRAYHYRNGMGDAQRAIEDFGEAIRVAPDSSDAYYSRALVYRDIGQDELAEVDDEKARELDHLAQDVYKQLPETAIPSDLPEAGEDAQANAEERGPKSAGEMLRESAEPGELGDMDLSSGTTPAPGDGPVAETELERQYRELVNGSSDNGNTKSEAGPLAPAGASPYSSLFGPALAPPDSQTPATTPGTTTTPLPGATPGGAPFNPKPLTGTPGNWQRPQLPPVQSPFAPRTTGPAAPTGATGMPQNAQSPFPQSNRGATGYVPPISPFGAPQGVRGATGVTRPFSGPATSSRPQNSAVRPLYPRDYVP